MFIMCTHKILFIIDVQITKHFIINLQPKNHIAN